MPGVSFLGEAMSKIRSEAVCVYGAKIINAHVLAMHAEIEGVLEAKDIEYIHRMRVASRRLRSALAIFEGCFSRKDFKGYSRDVRDVTRSLGTARDLDVQLLVLENVMPQFSDPKLAPGMRRLQLRLKQQRAEAQKSVITAIKTLQADNTLVSLAKWAAPFQEMSEGVYLFSPALYELAFSGINSRLKEFLDHAAYVLDERNVTELHNMRISAKRLRYTMEAFADLYGANFKPFINQTRKFQDILGEIHDADVWTEMIPRFIQEEGERISIYFGNNRPLKRLLPGLEAFRVNRIEKRKADYQRFLGMWQRADEGQIWDELLKLINAPLDLEVALRSLQQIEIPQLPEDEPTEDVSLED
jgi:CHAD domain-containing protein